MTNLNPDIVRVFTPNREIGEPEVIRVEVPGLQGSRGEQGIQGEVGPPADTSSFLQNSITSSLVFNSVTSSFLTPSRFKTEIITLISASNYFTTSFQPYNQDSITLFLNGFAQTNGIDFILSAATASTIYKIAGDWFSPSDDILIKYFT
jgi:hypothetical protein